jgi:ankyrin repeat protein
MQTLFDFLDSSESDAGTLSKIRKYLDGNTNVTLLVKHQKRTPSYSYNDSESKNNDTVAMSAAQYAMAKKKWQCAKFLILREPRALHIFPDDFSTPIHEVARCTDNDFLAWFWSDPIVAEQFGKISPENLNKVNEEKISPLMLAIKQSNDIEKIQKWFSFSNNTKFKDPKGRNYVHIAIETNQAQLVRVLLSHDNDLANMPTLAGAYPVHLAAMNNNRDAMEHLRNAGAKLDAKDDDFGTPLHWAARFGHIRIMEYLLQHGVSANDTNIDLDTPVHVVLKNYNAFVSNSEEKALYNALSLLLSYGGDLCIKNGKGKDATDLVKEHLSQDKAKRIEFHLAADEYAKQTVSEREIIAAANYFKARAAHTFDPQTQNAFCACLDKLVPAQPQQQQITRIWSQQSFASANNTTQYHYK